MTKKYIKTLAKASFSKNLLDKRKVSRIAEQLNRKDLKLYIKTLKNIEAKGKITILLPTIKNSEYIKSEIQKIFPDKNVTIKEDVSLIAGIRIIDDDKIYDFNLRSTFENLVDFISQ